MVNVDATDSTATGADREAHDGRVFASTLAGGFLFIGLLGYWRGRNTICTIAFSLSTISLLTAVIAPGRLRTIRVVWMKIGEAIGFVTTPIMMTLIYYLVITPIALVRRAFAKPSPVGDSNWQRRPPLPPASRMERQF